jgi:hypothetical protein
VVAGRTPKPPGNGQRLPDGARRRRDPGVCALPAQSGAGQTLPVADWSGVPLSTSGRPFPDARRSASPLRTHVPAAARPGPFPDARGRASPPPPRGPFPMPADDVWMHPQAAPSISILCSRDRTCSLKSARCFLSSRMATSFAFVFWFGALIRERARMRVRGIGTGPWGWADAHPRCRPCQHASNLNGYDSRKGGCFLVTTGFARKSTENPRRFLYFKKVS